jgi:hypothetical protein
LVELGVRFGGHGVYLAVIGRLRSMLSGISEVRAVAGYGEEASRVRLPAQLHQSSETFVVRYTSRVVVVVITGPTTDISVEAGVSMLMR